MCSRAAAVGCAVFIMIVSGIGRGIAQDASSISLGEVARRARASKPSTPTEEKKVLSNEDLHRSRGPIPDIQTEGPENSDEIIKAIHAFASSHPATETEAVLRDWFEDHMAIARRNVENNVRIAKARNTPFGADADPVSPYENYGRYREEQKMQRLGQQKDWNVMAENSEITERMMNTLRKVRDEFVGASGKYPRFDLSLFYVRYYRQP